MAQQQQYNSKTSAPSSIMAFAESQDPDIIAFQQHQASAARLSLAEEARTLVAGGMFGVLSVLSAIEPKGYPSGSVAEYVADSTGRMIFSFSSLSPHTGDLLADGRCSFTVMAEGFTGLSDARVNVVGHVVPLSGAEDVTEAKELYLSRHPHSFWVEFGDFTWFKMEKVVSARLVGGFGRVGKISAEEYMAANPDPIACFSAPVCGHMNADHAEATAAMIEHYVGIHVDEAKMLSLDRLGVNVSCTRQGEVFKCRLPFPQPAEDRKAIKDRIVEMTKAASKPAEST